MTNDRYAINLSLINYDIVDCHQQFIVVQFIMLWHSNIHLSIIRCHRQANRYMLKNWFSIFREISKLLWRIIEEKLMKLKAGREKWKVKMKLYRVLIFPFIIFQITEPWEMNLSCRLLSNIFPYQFSFSTLHHTQGPF